MSKNYNDEDLKGENSVLMYEVILENGGESGDDSKSSNSSSIAYPVSEFIKNHGK
jgi:hypothetical protein